MQGLILFISFIVLCIVGMFLFLKRSNEIEAHKYEVGLLEKERDSALKRMTEKEKELKAKEEADKTISQENNDRSFWQNVVKNPAKVYGTIRVTKRQLNKLLADAEFLANTSGCFMNVHGLYRSQKVMSKLPVGIKRNHANTDSQTN